MKSKVTIADVARVARVSTQTVSRVINNKGEISPATRQLVQDVIDQLGYRPNTFARSLVTNRTTTLGLVIPDIGNPAFAEVTRGVEDTARELGYNVFLCNTDQNPDREEAAILALADQRVSGILLCSARLPEERLSPILARLPGIVLVASDPVKGSAGSVRVDEVKSAIIMTQHFINGGRERIAFLAGRPGGPSHRQRLRGYAEALKAAGKEHDPDLIVFCSSNPIGGYEAASQLFSAGISFDGLICFNDLVAIGAMRACREHGRRVPEDVAVGGFGDQILASYTEPPLTTIHRSTHQLGEMAVRVLVNHLQGHDHEHDIVVAPKLVVRGSAP